MSDREKQDIIDLAAEENGGRALTANDEFFAPKENLLKPGRGIFIPNKYTDRGKWMDGWESRRRRTEGHDWCIIRLGSLGVIRQIDIDTNHFTGNFPSHASVDASRLSPFTSVDSLASNEDAWVELLSKSKLEGNSQNLFTIHDESPYSHLRLNIYPDGGVARFKAYGIPQPEASDEGALVEVASEETGGEAVACSNMHFGDMKNLIKPSLAKDMSDGWETRRRRGPGHDWVILRLGQPCLIERIVVDTLHFKGNYPDTCSMEGCFAPNASVDFLLSNDTGWTEILPKAKLTAHSEHVFAQELRRISPCTHVRLNIYPDGGVSRLRVYGKPVSSVQN